MWMHYVHGCDLSLLVLFFLLLFLLVRANGRTEPEAFAIICREHLSQRVSHGSGRCQLVQPPTTRVDTRAASDERETVTVVGWACRLRIAAAVTLPVALAAQPQARSSSKWKHR